MKEAFCRSWKHGIRKQLPLVMKGCSVWINNMQCEEWKCQYDHTIIAVLSARVLGKAGFALKGQDLAR